MLFNCTTYLGNLYQSFWGEEKSLEGLSENVLYQYGELQVKIDLNPIGGYRGKVGTLTISHVIEDKKIFTRWDDANLHSLAHLTQMILKIQETAGLHNTLIFARQDRDAAFKLSFVPYPKCNWIEKIQGFVHVIFGSPSLKKNQVEEIMTFYQSEFAKTFQIPSSDPVHREGKLDTFCRSEVIDKQKITNLSFDDHTYHVLYDHRPRGVTRQDPHLLIVPQADSGHCDGSQVSEQQRFHMLKIVQSAMQIFEEMDYSTMLYSERNGPQLQSVLHKHSHAQGIREFPETFFAKLCALMRQIYVPVLSERELDNCIQNYKRYNWVAD